MGKVITVKGYKGFRGIMEIRWSAKPHEEIYGDWIYTPNHFWHCGERTYPAELCTVGTVESARIITAKGHRVFTGVMRILPPGECQAEIYANWFYEPRKKRWYNDYGTDYPENICAVVAVAK